MADFSWKLSVQLFLYAAGLVVLWLLAHSTPAISATSWDLLPRPAQTPESRMAAELQCGPYKRMSEVLASKYSEAPRAIGTITPTRFMELYVSKKGSWTMVIIFASGNSCILASGQDWEDVPHKSGRKS